MRERVRRQVETALSSHRMHPQFSLEAYRPFSVMPLSCAGGSESELCG